MTFYPMLCQSMPYSMENLEQLERNGYSFEPKLDGIRAIVAVKDHHATLHNRNGVDISHRYPEMIASFAQSAINFILDGEIIVLDDGGNHSFRLSHLRDAQSSTEAIKSLSKEHPALFFAFDVIYQHETDWRKFTYSDRRVELHDLVSELTLTRINAVRLIASYSAVTAYRIVNGDQLEGIVAKRIRSTYRSGRWSDWIKLKPLKTGSFIVMGLEPGNGSRADTFGALQIGLRDEYGDFTCIGKVGSGFTDRDLVTIKRLWGEFESGAIPEPPVIEVQYQELTDAGALRFPVFKVIRSDVKIQDCSLNQLVYTISETPEWVNGNA